MSSREWEHDLEILHDRTAILAIRIEALGRIADVDEAAVVETLLDLAQSDTTPLELGRAVGATVARILHRQDRLSTAFLGHFTGEAYVAFDHEAARLLRESDQGE